MRSNGPSLAALANDLPKSRMSSSTLTSTARLEPNRLYGVAGLTPARAAIARMDTSAPPLSRNRSRAACTMRARRDEARHTVG